MGLSSERPESLAQDLVEGFALCELINKLVEIPDFLRDGILNRLDANATHDALDLRTVRIEGRGLLKKGLEINLDRCVLAELFEAVARQPANDRIDLILGPLLPFSLLDVERIDRGEKKL